MSTCPNRPRLLQELLAPKRAASPTVSCCMLSYLTVLTSPTVNQEQAHTFPTLHIRKRTFDEASLSDKPDPNKSPVQEFVTGSDEAPATPTPDSRKRTKESTMPGTPDTPSNRIDAFSSAQRAISEAIANSPKRNTR